MHSTPNQSKSSSRDTRRSSGSVPVSRRAAVVTELMKKELGKTSFQSESFVEDFIYASNSTVDARTAHAGSLLRRLCQPSLLVRGLSFHAPTQAYRCSPPEYSNEEFPDWFCSFANAVAALNAPLDTTAPGAIPAATPRNPTPSKPTTAPTWIVSGNHTPTGPNNDDRRPDFVLSSGTKLEWRHILIVGEHESKGKSVHAAFIQLSCYAEQVFMAQPFRMAILGVLTSRKAARIEFWRFDRAGALGSYTIDYSAGAGLRTLVLALQSMATLPHRLELCGFHTSSITWEHGPFPIDARSAVSVRLPGQTSTLHYKELVFTAPGIVSRGTRVWTGTLRDAAGTGIEIETTVAIKESWQSIGRTPEAELYARAAAYGVQGMPILIHGTTHEDVGLGVRRGHIPLIKPNAPREETQEQYIARYTAHMLSHNRVFSRLVLNQVGISIDTKTLSAPSIARALLAGAIGHASLFFRANILHRDISPYNILAFPAGQGTLLPPDTQHPGLLGRQRQLHGCLIDLDYAINTSNASAASGAKDRTGTYPFIAIQVLRWGEGGGVTHRYRHDLESFLYVLLYVALYPRPKDSRPPPEIVKGDMWAPTDPLGRWFNDAEYAVSSLKEAGVVSSVAHFSKLVGMVRPGFEAFGVAAGRIRQALWGGPGGSCELLEEGRQEEMEAHGAAEAAAVDAVVAAAVGLDGRRRRGPISGGRGRGKVRGASGLLRRPRNVHRPEAIVTAPPHPSRRWLRPDEVRVGVSNWEGYLEVLAALEDLVDAYSIEEDKPGARDLELESESGWETD